jgi:hypothetical protein
MEPTINKTDLRIRHQVYQVFAAQGRAPSFTEVASVLNLAPEEVRDSFHKLHANHMIFLQPGIAPDL